MSPEEMRAEAQIITGVVKWGADEIDRLHKENRELRVRMNALADVLSQHDLNHMLKSCGIYGWSPTDGWKMVDQEVSE